MNKRIVKVREDIRLTEKKIREMNEYLKTLKAKEKQLCDDEILKTMREMAGKGGDVMELLKQLQGESDMTRSETDSKVAMPNIDEDPIDIEGETDEKEALINEN